MAIAMTLLVLPLVDIGGEMGAHESLWERLSENSYTIFAFVLSFLVDYHLHGGTALYVGVLPVTR